MRIQTWIFHETATIPGVAGGTFHAGQEVDVDTQTNLVVAVRLAHAPPGTPIVEETIVPLQPAGPQVDFVLVDAEQQPLAPQQEAITIEEGEGHAANPD